MQQVNASPKTIYVQQLNQQEINRKKGDFSF